MLRQMYEIASYSPLGKVRWPKCIPPFGDAGSAPYDARGQLHRLQPDCDQTEQTGFQAFFVLFALNYEILYILTYFLRVKLSGWLAELECEWTKCIGTED
jgi:hypothetical protein